MIANTPYFARLRDHEGTLIPKIESLMRECGCVAVGDGFMNATVSLIVNSPEAYEIGERRIGLQWAGRECHSPITLTNTRLGRWPSNSP